MNPQCTYNSNQNEDPKLLQCTGNLFYGSSITGDKDTVLAANKKVNFELRE
jgi:hypothetical protein